MFSLEVFCCCFLLFDFDCVHFCLFGAIVVSCCLFSICFGFFGVSLFCGVYGRGVLMIHLTYFYVIILVSQVKMASGSLTKVIIRIPTN